MTTTIDPWTQQYIEASVRAFTKRQIAALLSAKPTRAPLAAGKYRVTTGYLVGPDGISRHGEIVELSAVDADACIRRGVVEPVTT